MTDDLIPEAEEAELLERLRILPMLEPATESAVRFSARLMHAGPPRVSRRWPWPLAIAATLALTLGGGWFREHQLHQREMAELRERLAAALDDPSAMTRLAALRTASTGKASDAIVPALTAALLHDPNTSVRVAAAEALGRLASPRALVTAAIAALDHETSPFVHAAILHAAAALDSADRGRILSRLIARPDLDPTLRADAAAALDP